MRAGCGENVSLRLWIGHGGLERGGTGLIVTCRDVDISARDGHPMSDVFGMMNGRPGKGVRSISDDAFPSILRLAGEDADGVVAPYRYAAFVSRSVPRCGMRACLVANIAPECFDQRVMGINTGARGGVGRELKSEGL